MYKVKVSYTDFNDNARDKNLYFNIFEQEALSFMKTLRGFFSGMGINVSAKEGVEDQAASAEKAMVAAPEKFVELVSTIVDASYGEQSSDGERFIKTPEIVSNFKNSIAYEAFFLKLLGDPAEIERILIGMMPARYRSDMQKAVANKRGDIVSIANNATSGN